MGCSVARLLGPVNAISCGQKTVVMEATRYVPVNCNVFTSPVTMHYNYTNLFRNIFEQTVRGHSNLGLFHSFAHIIEFLLSHPCTLLQTLQILDSLCHGT